MQIILSGHFIGEKRGKKFVFLSFNIILIYLQNVRPKIVFRVYEIVCTCLVTRMFLAKCNLLAFG